MFQKNQLKIFLLLTFFQGFQTLLNGQISFDFSSGIALNKSQFALNLFNDNSAYHNSYIYPIYKTDSKKPYSVSPFFNINLSDDQPRAFNLRGGISTGLYSENVIYKNSTGNVPGYHTRTVIDGTGSIKQLFIRLELTPTIQVKHFKFLFGLLNAEQLVKIVSTKIKAEKSVYDVYSAYNGGQFQTVSSTLISSETIIINDSPNNRGVEDHRTLFFPLYFGLEYEFNANKSTLVIGTKILASYSESSHYSYMIYASYRFRDKESRLSKQIKSTKTDP